MKEQFDTKYFRGQGPLLIEELDADGTRLGLHFIGDVSSAQATPQVERSQVRETVSGQGRTAASLIKSVAYQIAITMRSIRKDALKLALRGVLTDKAAASVTDEAHVARAGKFLALEHVKVSAVVVTNAGATVTYVADTDYVVHADEGMIEILDTGAIADASDILIDYNYASQHHVKVDPKQRYYRIVFSGMNSADNDKQVRADFYKVQLDPSVISLITDDTEEHELAGQLVHDTSRPAGDQLFAWKVED